jgi:serine/threonine-protein kinase
MWLALALVLAAGCSGEASAIVVPRWQLVFADGRPARVESVPIRFADVARRTHVTLSADVDVPASWRGQPLTLSVASWREPARLRVDGVEVPENPLVASFDHMGPQLWHLAAPSTRGAVLHLELDVDVWSRFEARLPTAPTLSPDRRGGPVFRRVSAFETLLLPAAPVVLLVIAFVHVTVWSLGRKQRAYLGFAAQAAAIALHAIVAAGGLYGVFGAATLAIGGVALSSSATGAVYFMHAQFDLGRVPRSVPLTWALVVLTALVIGRDPFLTERWLNPMHAIQAVFCLNYALVALGRSMARGYRPRGLTLIFAAWTVVGLASIQEVALVVFRVEILDGMRTLPVGAAIFSLLQAAVLAVYHAHSVDMAEQLNDELRRKIEERSTALLIALHGLSSSSGETVDPLAPGAIIEGRYRVVRLLGAGGMGSVHEVERLADGGRFALKRMAGTRDPGRFARFAREAQIAARLDHPNLVTIVDFDASREGWLFMVMELVDGRTLREAASGLTGRPALAVLAGVARGLVALHAGGIVHRDLKPSNILVAGTVGTPGFVVKIADFGVSALRQPNSSDGDTLTDTSSSLASPSPTPDDLTRTGAVVGTPLYMAPEQARSAREATAASDVYCFALIAHELLTGTRFVAALGQAPQLGKVAGITPGLVELLTRALAEDPAARPSAAELAAALSAV